MKNTLTVYNCVIFTSFWVFLGCENVRMTEALGVTTGLTNLMASQWLHPWQMWDISLGFMEDIAMVTISGLVREIIPKWPQDSGQRNIIIYPAINGYYDTMVLYNPAKLLKITTVSRWIFSPWFAHGVGTKVR